MKPLIPLADSTDKATAVRDRLGRPLKDLRISLTDRCNLRCTYCMPQNCGASDIHFMSRAALLDFEEIEHMARVAIRLGVNKIRLTGGEPLLRKDIASLVERLARLEGLEDLALSSNGLLLGRHARELKAAGLHRVSVSLDSLDDVVFGKMNGLGIGARRVLEGIDAALDAGLTPVKINVVVQAGVNDAQLLALCDHFRHTACIVRFIEYMDVGTMNGWRSDAVLPAARLVERIHNRYPLQALPPRYPGEVARRYAYADGAGEIGVISSVSRPFCGDCTRLRLSADGQLHTCLFGPTVLDLKGPLRAGATEEELLAAMRGCWQAREDRYSEIRAEIHAAQDGGAGARESVAARTSEKSEMFRIGG